MITHVFSYNIGDEIPGTIQVGDLAIATTLEDFSGYTGSSTWWNGPDEELGYVIAYSDPSGNHPTPMGTNAYLGFYRSDELTSESFLNLFNSIRFRSGEIPLTSISEALAWLEDNGFWTSFEGLLDIGYIESINNIKTTLMLSKTNYNNKQKLAILEAINL
jgi:hypothetical protein